MLVYFSFNQPFDNLELNVFHFIGTQVSHKDTSSYEEKFGLYDGASLYNVYYYDGQGRKKSD